MQVANLRPKMPLPAWRPAPVTRSVPPKQMGAVGLSLDFSSLPQVILAGSGGAGLMYASKLFPEPFNTIATVGGIGLLGYAAYALFGSPSGKDTNVVPPDSSFGIASPADFRAISGSFLQPLPGSTESFSWFSDKYPVRVQVTNPSLKPVTITLQLLAKETPYWFYAIPFGQSDEYVADTKVVNLAPGQNTPVDFDAAAVKSSRWFSGKIGLELTLRKSRIAGGSPDDTADIAHTSVKLI